VTGDPQNGNAAFVFDALGRLATYTPPGGSAVPYGWDEVPNRTSAGGVATTFDAADRPTSTGFANDLDGRWEDRTVEHLDAAPLHGTGAMKALCVAVAVSLVLAGCGGDPLWFLPPPADLTGKAALGEPLPSGCAGLAADDGKTWALILPQGWAVDGSILNTSGGAMVSSGTRLHVSGRAGDADQTTCPGRPFVVVTIEILKPDP
jgi:YD repeat-containing protein